MLRLSYEYLSNENTMKKWFLCLLLFYSIQINAQYFKHLGMKEGLSQLSVLSIYQDELGRMWFGTREGVNVYDGKRISVYKPWSADMSRKANYLPVGNEVKMLTGNQKGDIYMCVEGALVRYDLYKETFTRLNTNRVRALTADGNDVWCVVGDSLFRCQMDSLTFHRKLEVPSITSLLISENKTWVGTSDGLFLFERQSMKQFLPGIEIYGLFKSSREELWIGTRENGLYRIKKNGELVTEPYDPHSKNAVVSSRIRNFAEDNQGNIWFGTFDGLQMYDPYKKNYCIYQKKERLGTLAHPSVFPVYKDNQGTIWIGTYYGGVNYFNPQKDVFTYYPCDAREKDCLNFQLTGPMVEDKERVLWIGTDGGGLNCLNRKTGEFTYFTAKEKNSILHNNVKCICYDEKRDCIYVGTYLGGLSRYDRKTRQFYNFLEDFRKTGEGPNQEVLQVVIKENWLYIAARNGFWRMNLDNGNFQKINDNTYSDFIIDSNGYAWVTNYLALYRIKLEYPFDKEEFKLENAKEKYRISKILQGSTGIIYISTLGNGFYAYDEKDNSLAHYTVENNNLLSNYCYTMVETPTSNLLVTGERGFTLFSPFSLSLRPVEIGVNNGITVIADGCGAYVTRDEQIFVGGVDGMISFQEKGLDIENNGTHLYFSDLQVHNSKIYPEDETGILKQAMPFTQKLELSASQNNIIVSFSRSNYLSIYSNTRYEYMLDGFDKDWIPATHANLYYTNIPPGKYILKLREKSNSTDYDSAVHRQEISLNIVVHSPWYNTVWAWGIYALLIAGSIYFLWHVKMTKKIFALSLEQEKKEKEHIEELNQTKLRFFMNISHEFRTLLTLIIGQIEFLMQIHKLPPSIHNRLLKVHKNAMHMRLLISELLDFRKQEQGHMKLKIVHRDIVPFTHEVYLSFYEFAQKKDIVYSFEFGNENVLLWFDPSQLQKALFNLLSNAFKYTPEKGKIQVSINKVEEYVKIEVKDSGCGISEEQTDKIFERFYQVNDSVPGLTMGTGIGLSLAKGIVEAHKGSIRVTSKVGKGSTFTILIPMGNSHFSEEEMGDKRCESVVIEEKDSVISSLDTDGGVLKMMKEEEDTHQAINEMNEKPTILIVEDSCELMELLEDIFMPIYHVCKATNGAEGFEMTRQLQPDIVLSDVMMPVMTGKEMCFKIKNSFDLFHIPVVLLTAQTAVEYMIDGYTFGADDYITKPFNVKLLISRCNNLVRNRKTLFERFRNSEKVVTKSVDALNVVDQKLMDEATEIIRKNFDNFDFDINVLASELNMGRSKLFTRIKEVTGITPNEFVLNLKLKEAVRLLKDAPEYNVAEIAYRLGFSSPRYFSRCFKAFYGVNPQSYRKVQGEVP